VCLLLLQAGFFLVDRGYVRIDGVAYAEEPGAEPETGVEPNEPPDVNVPADSNEPPEPGGAPEMRAPEDANRPGEPNESPEPGGAPETAAPEDANEPAEPNDPADPDLGLQPPGPAQKPGMQLAALPFLEFLGNITWGQLSWTVNLVNAVLILTATLYCLTLLFSLKVSMHGRLGGINHITRAFFLSLLLLVLLLPWQKVFGSMVTGAVFTPTELKECYLDRAAEAGDMLDTVLYYLRFSGYGVLMLLLLILSQIRSLRWAKAILRRLEII
jgi:hypothetical protein